jgi:hypothetical protein
VGSSAIVDDSTGMNADEKAPSANSFRSEFGTAKTMLMTSAGPEPPKNALMSAIFT